MQIVNNTDRIIEIRHVDNKGNSLMSLIKPGGGIINDDLVRVEINELWSKENVEAIR